MIYIKAKPFRLPGGYLASFSFDIKTSVVEVEWEPNLPPPEARRAGFVRAYRKARNEFLADVSSGIGGPVFVIEAGGSR